MAAEPPGGRHGTRHQADRRSTGRDRPASAAGHFGRCFPQLPDHSALRLAGHGCLHRPASEMRNRHSQSNSTFVPPGRRPGLVPDQAAGPSAPSHSCVLAGDETGRTDQPPDAGLWLLELVGGPPGRALGQGHRHSFQRRPASAAVAPRGLFRSSSQAHHERQTRRGSLRESQEKAGSSKKTP